MHVAIGGVGEVKARGRGPMKKWWVLMGILGGVELILLIFFARLVKAITEAIW